MGKYLTNYVQLLNMRVSWLLLVIYSLVVNDANF